MSVPYIAWAFQQRDMTAAQKLVLIDLCERANGDRVCFPSFPKIAQDCGLSLRAAYAAVRYLCDVRHLIAKVTDKEERSAILGKAGARSGTLSNVYRILRPSDGNGIDHTPANPARVEQENSPTPAKYARSTPANPARVEAHTPAPDAGLPLQNMQQTPAKYAPEPSKEPITEPKTRAGARRRVGFFSDLKGSKQVAALPPMPEREPTVAEIEASRKAAADAIAAMPKPIATAIQSLGRALHGVAYAEGRSPQRDRWEQLDAMRPRPKASFLSPEQLKAARMVATLHREPAYA